MPIRRGFPAVLLAAVTLALAACSAAGATARPDRSPGPPSGAPLPTSPSTDQSASGANAVDRLFIDMMVPHHQSAIEMARLAEQRATHAELKDLANRIISAQQSEIDQLRQWRQAWFGSSETPPMTAMPLMPGMSMPEHAGMSQGMGSMASASPGASKTAETMDMTADVEALRSADPFDREFIDAMIAHHQMAIEAATILTANGQRPELEALAQGIIAAQQKEIDQMKGWRAVWFPGA